MTLDPSLLIRALQELAEQGSIQAEVAPRSSTLLLADEKSQAVVDLAKAELYIIHYGEDNKPHKITIVLPISLITVEKDKVKIEVIG